MRKEVSAGGLVFKKVNNKWQVLLVRHAGTDYWGFPKGLVGDFKKGELPEKAALREVEEEGGVKAKIIAPLPKPTRYHTSWRGELIDKTVHYFVMKYLSGNPDDHDHEISEARFMSFEEAKQTLTYKNDLENLKQALPFLPRTSGVR
jgi:ADP-ribose pyrophosphatase YjhB (NUDIX family)